MFTLNFINGRHDSTVLAQSLPAAERILFLKFLKCQADSQLTGGRHLVALVNLSSNTPCTGTVLSYTGWYVLVIFLQHSHVCTAPVETRNSVEIWH